MTEARKLYLKDYREKNKDKRKIYKKEYDLNHSVEKKLSSKNYYETNKQKIKTYQKENKDKILERTKLYLKNKKQEDSLFKLSCSVRVMVYRALINKGRKKNTKSEIIIGCSFKDFKLYLESKFEPWMTWENYGKYNGQPNYGWDIDHIVPVSSAVNDGEVISLNHYINLQPLCSYINRNVKKDNLIIPIVLV